ncbi:hypothetical protein [Streptomyces sp. NPDC015125]|uniref:hypothetical protein n=1 Tax=Streptomyces sp. NPDC015125 TaxID=3364938 RepID=UPI0036F849A6
MPKRPAEGNEGIRGCPGARAACDPRLLTGVLFGQLGAMEEPRRFYEELPRSEEFTATVG